MPLANRDGQRAARGERELSSPQAEVVVVTGLSGAGRSTALRALEDLEFFCVDNLPTLLVQQAVESCERGGMRRLALGIDVRVGNFLDGASQALRELAASGRSLQIVFLDASNEVLIRRFNSTRRPHPLSTAATAGPGEPAGLSSKAFRSSENGFRPSGPSPVESSIPHASAFTTSGAALLRTLGRVLAEQSG